MRPYNPTAARRHGLGYSRFARHYSGNHYYFLFLSLLRCFSSGGWLPLCSGFRIFNTEGCPIRKSSDLTLVCSSPKLIAAYHVLHRLSDPRHSPYALNCFKKFKIQLITELNVCYSCFTTYYFPNMSKNLFHRLICRYAKVPMNCNVKGIEPYFPPAGYIKFEKNCFFVFAFLLICKFARLYLWRISESNR